MTFVTLNMVGYGWVWNELGVIRLVVELGCYLHILGSFGNKLFSNHHKVSQAIFGLFAQLKLASGITQNWRLKITCSWTGRVIKILVKEIVLWVLIQIWAKWLSFGSQIVGNPCHTMWNSKLCDIGFYFYFYFGLCIETEKYSITVAHWEISSTWVLHFYEDSLLVSVQLKLKLWFWTGTLKYVT